MKLLLTILTLLFCATVVAQSNPQAYVLYNERGKKTSYRKMMKELRGADVILFGEYHNNPISHWMQMEIVEDLPDYTLGMEMFETDEQGALDKFMADSITVEELDSLTGGLWNNFQTDYLPLLQRAQKDSATVYATNIPRAYARMVFQRGFVVLQSLPEDHQRHLPPLPPPYDPELPGYKAMTMPGQGAGHGGENFPKAQAIKDATMGWFIAKNVTPGSPFFHINGSYHSDDFEGIGWYLRKYKPQLKVVTISTVEQPDVSELAEEFAGKANYIMAVPGNMTKTY